jgi:sulfite reductase (ferredoxin)
MSKLDVEALKRASNGLRGSIPEELATPADHFSDEAIQLLKFHGVYQQDDRDARKSARETGAGRDFSCMIRTKCPGGFLPADFYLGIDKLADLYGNGSIRVTTRGALQLHGVHKSNLHEVIHQINEHLGSTLAACGDVNRNVMATPFPLRRPDYDAAHAAAFAIADALTPRTKAYVELWSDGELAHTTQSEPVDEPIYGAAYLPRKFKIAVTVPGDNSVDLYTNDAGIVPLVADDGTIEGYNLTVGGGLGMTHGKHATFPRLADEFAFVTPEQLIAAVQAIVIVQRDYGDRTNRKHAQVHDRGSRHRMVPRGRRKAGRFHARQMAPAARMVGARVSGLGRARRRQVVLRARHLERTRRRSRHGALEDRAARHRRANRPQSRRHPQPVALDRRCRRGAA